jgi:hypothetical protein
MKERHNIRVKLWVAVGALFMLMSLASVGYAQTVSLTEAEKYWLTYMREEEKLARDVYLSLYDKWQSRVFKNISVSEQTHMDAIKNLLDKYGIADPAEGKAAGVFTNRDLQALYDELIEVGGVSLVDALEVGVEMKRISRISTRVSSTKRKEIITCAISGGLTNHLVRSVVVRQ